MRNKETEKSTDELNVEAAIEAGKINKYSKRAFKRHGSRGGKIGGPKRWEGVSKKEREEHGRKMGLASAEKRKKKK